jgi:hypothetical protein
MYLAMTLQHDGKAWNTDRSRMAGGVGGARPRRRLSFSRNVHETVLQAGIFATLAYIDDCMESNYTGEQIYIFAQMGRQLHETLYIDFKVEAGLGHHILRRHLHDKGFSDNATCRKG